jgi:excisionase family DNA binding protein
MTKAEVCEYLGKSKRTVDSYMASGRLPVRYFKGVNGRQSIFDRAAVERFKADSEIPMVRAVPEQRPNSGWRSQLVPASEVAPKTAVAVTSAADAQAVATTIAAVLREAMQPAPAVKPWLTLSEASDYSGLSESYLVRAARDGSIRAINLARNGGRAFWRFNRDALGK